MARFRRSSSKSHSPIRPLRSPFSATHLDSPSSEEPDEAKTPQVPAQGPFSTLLGLWPNRSGSVVSLTPVSPENEGAKSKFALQGSIKGQRSRSSINNEVRSPSLSPRLPRHVPIVIPDFANPYNPHLRPVTSETNLSSTSNQSTPKLRRVRKTITPIRLTADTIPNRSLFVPPSPSNATQAVNMNSSQVSLATSEASTDGGPSPQPLTGPGPNVGIAPVANQPNNGPTHLSGLVCSVHRTTGQRPHALVGATTTILGDKLFVFGGRLHSRTKPQLTSDLFQLDLIKRHWTRVNTLGDVPPPRYFHSVCALGDSKLVCYGGMSPASRQNGQAPNGAAEPQPEVVVMSDIHVYDVPTRTWSLISAAENPQGRYAHCAAILPSSAVFTSANAPLSAIHHNPPSSDPHSGTLGVELDGTGGAEMVVVGGQDSANNYIEQINVFNLRSLKWTATTTWDRKCGAYKSMVVPMTGLNAESVGQNIALDDLDTEQSTGTPMLIYSNYNFLDVKLELQVRMPDGSLAEKPMAGPVSPPGLRFPNGGILDNHFVVSGTYLTSSKHEYALWALDLKTLTWGRIDTNVSIFEQGSWNRGVLWNRRNTFVILGHRERSLVDDYNHRRINFSHVCMVELEAFGLYDNPRKTSATSGYVSISAPVIPRSLRPGISQETQHAGGRPYTDTATQLGHAALNLPELSDMELVALGGERIPCNSYLLSRRWGPYFNTLLMESTTSHDSATIISEAATLRPLMQSQASRNSSITITQSVANGIGGPDGPSTSKEPLLDPQRSMSRSTTRTLVAGGELPNPASVPASSRPRSLYLPHMVQTIQLLLEFLYTSSLPPVGTELCTPHTLCSLLQMARPYQIDGLLEATVERLHEVLDGRNAAAVFNAAAMAAGGGRGLGAQLPGTMGMLARRESEATAIGDAIAGQKLAAQTANLKVTGPTEKTDGPQKKGHGKSNSIDSTSTDTSTSASTDVSQTDTESMTESTDLSVGKDQATREVWTGDLSSVIGLQKRGLRGLMEGRRLRERANTIGSAEERII